jgi:hypothetical protein
MNRTLTPYPCLVECPACRKPSDSVKCYRMLLVLFLLIGVSIGGEGHVGCPACTRLKILWYSLVNLISANLLWPVIVLPWALIALACSFRKGHSAEVLAAIREA